MDANFLALTDTFNSIKINSGKEDGKDIAKSYNVVGVPHVIFTDAAGNEIDRLIGYAPPEEYIPWVKDILNGVNTLPELEKSCAENPNDLEIWVRLAGKYRKMGRRNDAKNLYEKLLTENPQDMQEDIEDAHFYLAECDYENDDISKLVQFISGFPGSSQISSAWRLIARYHSAKEDTTAEIDAMQKMAETDPDNPNTMNEYAWRMTELNRNLDDALIKARKGVDLADVSGKPMIMDTEAEILWLMDRTKEAIDMINRVIEMEPEEEYYKEQLEKFTEALQES